ncbi:hypothetical protein HYY75_04565 [bacterium]|nr:hypothetical protein [bacterium]
MKIESGGFSQFRELKSKDLSLGLPASSLEKADSSHETQDLQENPPVEVLEGEKNGEEKGKSDPFDPLKTDLKKLAIINELKRTDQEVRAHEASHAAAGGGYVTGGPSFEYKTGPDGKRYAVGGEVQIDTSPVPDNPQATIAKMEAVRRAALAPSNPSAQDLAVASSASRAEEQARAQLREETKEETQKKTQKPQKSQPMLDVSAFTQFQNSFGKGLNFDRMG